MQRNKGSHHKPLKCSSRAGAALHLQQLSIPWHDRTPTGHQTTFGRGGHSRWAHIKICVVQHVVILEEDPGAAATTRARYHVSLVSYHARA